MKPRKATFAVLFAILTVGYLFAYFFYLKGKELDTLYLIILIAMIVISVIFLGALVIDQRLLSETIKFKDTLNTQRNLVKSIEENNELITKNFPVGILVYDEDFVITYGNAEASNIFETDVMQKEVKFLSKDLFESIKRSSENAVIKVYKKEYNALIKFDSNTIYLSDVSEEVKANKQFDDNKTSIISLTIDNTDDAFEEIPVGKKSEFIGEFTSILDEWALKFNACSMGSSSQYAQKLIIKETDLKKLIDDKFSILNDINRLSRTEGIFVTLSIGVGTGTQDLIQLGLLADRALELAHDRGGAQAVVYDGVNYESYGCNVFSSVKKTKIQAKIYYSHLVDRIKKSSSVLIMPHIDTDVDAFGAAIGVAELCSALNTPAKVVLDRNRIDSTTRKLIDASKTEYIKMSKSIIYTDEVQSFFTGDTTLILIDHHIKDLSVYKKAYSMANYITVIDHHRINDELNIKFNTEFIDHNASSSVEIVTALIDLSDIKIDLHPFVATLMLTGMMVDTTAFTSNMGEESFKACSILAEYGADSYKAKFYLREPIDEQIERLKLLEDAEIVASKIALIACDDKIVSKDFLAKTADVLLNIENIQASFVIGYIDKNVVGVSGRSDNTFNIYREVEKLGGGGHFSKGAAQIKDRDIKSVKEEIILNIKQTLKGDSENMKVILVEDVKKQGKKGDVIECTPGYANFLLSKKLAVEANASNMAVLDEEKAETAKREALELEVAKKTKALVEEAVVVVKVKIGDNGKFFGSISAKQLEEALKAQRNIEVDKRKISLEDKIESLGTYKCFVKLHKEVTATLTFEVKEQ